ncbi:MAG: zinc-binding alcohol dehydrogenase family protein [Burkholderiaceae bacterium]
MKAVGLTRDLPIDDPDSLQDLELPRPVPKARDLLVRVEAVSVNPIDTKVRAPRDGREDPPRVLGWDAAGVVEAVGDDVELFAPGDAVYYAGSIIRAGANAQYHCVDERIVGHKPASLDFAAAAALPLTAITAWEALFERLHVDRNGRHAGRRLLVVGGAGGVGSIAIQLARRLAGLQVVATASRPKSKRWCLDLGADLVIDHSALAAGGGDPKSDARVYADQLEAAGFGPIDFALCTADLDRQFGALAEALAPFGSICSIVDATAPLPMMKLRRKSASFAWEGMFTRSMFETPDMIEQHRLLEALATALDDGRIRTTMSTDLGTIDAKNLRRAHALIESRHTTGKLVLSGFV